jgi:hypothetical protein
MTPRILASLLVCACVSLAPRAATAQSPAAKIVASQVFDRTLTNTEKEFVSLVAVMPADKFSFAPTAGKFDGVRTFGEEAKHAAYVLNEVAAALLGEKNPSSTGPHENGPENLTGKDNILAYVKAAFGYAHKAVARMTEANLLELTADPFDAKGTRTRVDSVSIMFWHTYDHYGQMVEYARMNGIVPPASQ